MVGLGNPGREYDATRHNLGFRVVDRIVDRCGARRGPDREQYDWWTARIGSGLILVKPTTFMNRSGRAVAALMQSEGLPLASLLVVCDDVNIPLGRLRLRGGGSDGGHNGLFSIEERIGEREFARLRLGVGPRPEGDELSDFVLSEFCEDEREIADALVARGAEAAIAFARSGLDAAMRDFNGPVVDGDRESE